MWFKNLQVYRLTGFKLSAQELHNLLVPQAFGEATSLDMQTQGWVSPRDNDMLVHTVNRQMLLRLTTEKKLLPASVINQVTKAKAAELEDQQGFKPGKRQMRELKEQVTDELLPRAFSIRSSMHVWIDPVNNWLVIDAASASKAEEALKLLIKAIDKFPLDTLRVERSPVASMTDWLASDEAPANFTVDQDTELRATGEGKATVRYVRHTLEAEDVRRHIAAGKQCTKLAMTWADRVSFVLNENLTIKRLAPLDVLKENGNSEASAPAGEEERFDSDFLLMTGEVAKLLGDLVIALGGEAKQQ